MMGDYQIGDLIEVTQVGYFGAGCLLVERECDSVHAQFSFSVVVSAACPLMLPNTSRIPTELP